MTCQQVTSLMVDYLAKDLDLDTASNVERHLSLCPDCNAFQNTYKRTVQVVQFLQYEDISHERINRIRRFLEDATREVSINH